MKRKLTVRFTALVEELMDPLRDCPDAEARWSVIEFMRTELSEGPCPDDEMAMRRYCRKRERLTPWEQKLLQELLQRTPNGGWGLECVEADRQHMGGVSGNRRVAAEHRWAKYERDHPGWVPPARRVKGSGAFPRDLPNIPDANASANALRKGAFGDAFAIHPLPQGASSRMPAPSAVDPPSPGSPETASGQDGPMLNGSRTRGGPRGDNTAGYVQACPHRGCTYELELAWGDFRVRQCQQHPAPVAMVVRRKDPRNGRFFAVLARKRLSAAAAARNGSHDVKA